MMVVVTKMAPQQLLAMVVMVMAAMVVTGGHAQGTYAYASYGEYDDYGAGGAVYDSYDAPYEDYTYDSGPADAPSFTSTSQTLKVEVGKDVTIPCHVDNLGDYVIMLKKVMANGEHRFIYVGDNMLKPARRIIKNGTDFTIHGARRTHAGEYICRIESSPAVELSHIVDVLYAPTVKLVTPPVQSVTEGANVTLECQADGNPTPEVTWSKATGDLPEGATQEMEEPGVAVLEVVGVEVGDGGEYVCAAHNGVTPPHHHPHITTTTTLHVLYPPKVTATQHIEITEEGEALGTLECEVTGYPAPTVTWRRGDMDPLPSTAHVSPTHTVHLHPLTKDDLGGYTCSAENDYGVDEETVELRGLMPPPQVTSGGPGGARSHTLTITTPLSLTPPVPLTTYRLRLREVHENQEAEEAEEYNEIEDAAGEQKEQQEEEEEGSSNTALEETEGGENGGNNTTDAIEEEGEEEMLEDTKDAEENKTDAWTTYLYPFSEAGDVDDDEDEGADEEGVGVLMSHTIEGLEPHTHYQVTVALQNTFGWSPESEVLEFWTMEETTTTTTTTSTTTLRPPRGQMVVSGVADRCGSVRARVLRVVLMAVAVLVLGTVVW